jgi:cation diffusion facilitator family transporter
MPPPSQRRTAERLAARTAMIGIGVSALLGAMKIAAGLAANSVATVSDGFESAADVLTSSIVALGLWAAAKPPDAEHPYGHGRYETLTGLGVGTLLAAVGTGICLRSFEGRNDLHTPAAFAVWPLLVSIVVKTWLAAAKLRAGRKAGSVALTADAWHDWVDVVSGTVAVVAVLLAVYAPGMSGADHYGGSVIGLIVIFLGVHTVRETALNLVDTMPEPRRVQELRDAALRVQGALGIDKCFARRTGLRYHVDLHLEVDPTLTVRDSHEIAGAVKRHLKADLDWVEDVLIHVEPHATGAEERAARPAFHS